MARNGQGTARRTYIALSEIEYSDEEIAWMKAIRKFMEDERRPFPTWSEVLEVARAEGYRKVAAPMTVRELRLIETESL